jgi:transcriptional regulator with XRE-family HTH domain
MGAKAGGSGFSSRKETANAFGEVLRQRRKEAGLTQEDLAERCELSSKFIARLERAEQQPSLYALLRIGPTLGTTATELVAEVEKALR